LSSNNEMCYNTKTQVFSRTKHGLNKKIVLQQTPTKPSILERPLHI